MKNMEHPFPSNEVIHKFEEDYEIREAAIIAWFENARRVMDPTKYGAPQNKMKNVKKEVSIFFIDIFKI